MSIDATGKGGKIESGEGKVRTPASIEPMVKFKSGLKELTEKFA
jgi:hypothetical protein